MVYAALVAYDATLGSSEPFVLLENNAHRTYVAQSLVVGKDGIDSADGRAHYTSENSHYELTGDTLSVPLVHQKDGVTITKTYTFSRGQYPIKVTHNINNTSDKA